MLSMPAMYATTASSSPPLLPGMNTENFAKQEAQLHLSLCHWFRHICWRTNLRRRHRLHSLLDLGVVAVSVSLYGSLQSSSRGSCLHRVQITCSPAVLL